MTERDDLQHAADLLSRLIPQATPGPWRDSTVDGNQYGALVADTCIRNCDAWNLGYSDPPSWASHPHNGYGGCLVAESQTPSDRRLMAVMRNAAEALPALLTAIAEEDPMDASRHALALARAIVATHTPREGGP